MRSTVTLILFLTLTAAAVIITLPSQHVHAEKRTRIQVEPTVPQFVMRRVLVKFNDNIDSTHAQQIVAALGGRDADEIPGLGIHIVELPDTASENAFANAFNARPEVDFAELDRRLSVQQVQPNDPLYPSWYLTKIDAPNAWSITSGSSSVVIAILDTGVDSAHPDLTSKFVPGWNIYNNNSDTNDVFGHGTGVAGVAAAASNNGIGVASVAWGCGIMPIRVSDSSGMATASAIASGLSWAADHGARVANISYYVTGSKTISSAAKYFQNKGGVVVAASGNYGVVETAPDDPYIITVGATDPQDLVYSYSNRGSNLDLVAPGNNTTTLIGGIYGAGGGTSFAAPVVAGVAALVISVNPKLSPAEITSVVKQNADDLGLSGWDSDYGSGRVNAGRTVAAALNSVGVVDAIPPTVDIISPQSGQKITGSTVSVQVVASDNVQVVKNELYVDGILVATSATSPFTTKWNTRKASSGSHEIRCKAYDAAGNSGVSSALTIYK